MIQSKKLTLGICLVLLIILIVGYVIMTKTNGRNAQIKDTFNQTLKLYPTKNLDDFYDKEGFRDQEFDKGDKGTWIISSEMNIQLKGESLKSRGMILYMNRNTKRTTGYFF
ncbi:TPA: Csa1 family protein, partial [Staphylococcus aureus]|nr:Csa1 family protein [Staphylococcus aureus]HDG3265806.1 Csa1 family protein [Staphylococcus aureus]